MWAIIATGRVSALGVAFVADIHITCSGDGHGSIECDGVPIIHDGVCDYLAGNQGASVGCCATGPNFHGVNTVWLMGSKFDFGDGSTLDNGEVSLGKAVCYVEDSSTICADGISEDIVTPGDPDAITGIDGPIPSQVGGVSDYACLQV
ncbi:MAG: hypothetical protein BWY72_02477 [Bacteroidetes bacterium ADurb.Bin416]|nr:MAG: hypothetical protein BWY72_02477 [Bacteroidetes bacterium ADurb.Bin416]